MQAVKNADKESTSALVALQATHTELLHSASSHKEKNTQLQQALEELRALRGICGLVLCSENAWSMRCRLC